jgi:large subunit ribosomal protein L21
MAEATIAKKKTTPASRKAAQGEPKTAPKARKTAPKERSSAFAIIATGGKQYIVREGDRVKIEKLQGEHKVGDTLTFDSVLLTAGAGEPKFGTPFIKGSFVSATLKAIDRSAKVTVIKYKQKSRYFKKNGHRQPYFEVQIDSIK